MQFLPDYIDTYATEHTKVTDKELLKKLERQTHLEIMMPQMLSGDLQGQYLAFVSRMIRPKCILEIGTYTGYSAICMSSGLQEGGVLHTIDNNPEVEQIASEYIEKAGLSQQIVQHQGDAMEIIPELDYEWDLVFMDADKINYTNYYDLLIPRLKKGSYIIADNVLWNGTVPQGSKMKKARALRLFNKQVMEDKRVKNMLLPIRDGLMMIEKI
jgi:predicted O-methyltransferase YrrM